MLQLHKIGDGKSEYAEFLHAPKKKFTDFGMSNFNNTALFPPQMMTCCKVGYYDIGMLTYISSSYVLKFWCNFYKNLIYCGEFIKFSCIVCSIVFASFSVLVLNIVTWKKFRFWGIAVWVVWSVMNWLLFTSFEAQLCPGSGIGSVWVEDKVLMILDFFHILDWDVTLIV